MPEKEKEVLLLTLKDRTNKEIANELGIATSTVKAYK
ncbi:MAG: LuxR C-terminal-related transcriptional regulator [Draconibacterium sp.]|nr:LuxR C-terminal-related transcriptional regulator [Draconibacterium sp.]